jgi:hypothetical protein
MSLQTCAATMNAAIALAGTHVSNGGPDGSESLLGLGGKRATGSRGKLQSQRRSAEGTDL